MTGSDICTLPGIQPHNHVARPMYNRSDDRHDVHGGMSRGPEEFKNVV